MRSRHWLLSTLAIASSQRDAGGGRVVPSPGYGGGVKPDPAK